MYKLTMDNNLRNHRAAEDGSVLRENLEGRDKSKTFNDDFLSTSQTTSENIFPLHLREDSHDIWLHPSTKTLPNPIKTTGVSLVGVLNPSVDNHSSTESGKADDLVCHGRTKLIERSLVSQRPFSGCSSKSFEVLKWVAAQENSPNKFHLEQCHSIHTEIDDHSSGTFLNEDQLRPSFGSQMPFPNHHLNSDKEDVISTFVEEVRHLRQEISSQTSKQEALETLMQKALVELEEANANIVKLHSEIARSTSDDKMTITSIQSSLNILKNEIAQDSFKRTEEISKLETKFSDSQQALEQIEVILIKNEVTSGQRVEVENSLKADLQEVQNKLSALLRDKDAILPNWASFSHAVGTPAQLVPIMQQPVPSEIARKALSIIDPTTDKETSKTELACQSRTESTSEEPRQPDNSEQIKVGLENMVIATFEEPAVADVPSTEESSNKDQIFDSFNKMDLKTELLHGIYSYGLVRPTTLQQKAIVPCLEGNDVVVRAQPGTGKTTMLSISILQKIDTSIKQCQAIVLVPNGEHAQQTQQLLLSLGEQMGTQCHAFVNGTSACEDLKILSSSGVHIVIGPPGRVFDMISRRALNTKYIKLVVLDEADKMLSRGFKDQIYEIFKHFSKNIQVILLSTIMPNDVGEDELFGKYNENDLDVDDEDDVDDDFDVDDVVEVTKLIMRDPIRILIKQEELTLEDIQHFYVTVSTWERANGKAIIAFARTWYNTVSERERYDTLHVTQAIIFCSSADVVHEIMNQLVLCLPIEPTNFLSMHDQMDQKERERILRKFCSGSSRFLITTDLRPVRPIYWQQVSLVINYDIPLTVETYINSFKRTEEISKLEKKFIDSQQALEQIEAILIKNKVTSGQRVEVEHFLKSDLQEVQNKLSAPLRDKDAILPNCAPFSHAVGTPAQLVSITQQPVPSEIARKAFSIIDPTTDKETSKTELASQSRTESTSEEPRQPDNSEQIEVVSENMVATTFEESSVANVPSNEESSNKDQMDTFTSFWPFVNGTLIVCNLTLDCEEFSPKDVVYAVNCGGDYFKDSHGINYQSDKSSSGIASDFGKQFLVFGRVSQSDSVLYQTEKYDHNTFGYDVPLDGDGDYVLVLKFSEVYWNSPGAKVFGVLLNNRHRVISDLDIYEKVGKAVAHDEYIPFSVQNGKMNFNGESSTVYDSFRLDFLKGEVENPKINAFYLYKGDIKDVPRLPPLSSAVK